MAGECSSFLSPWRGPSPLISMVSPPGATPSIRTARIRTADWVAAAARGQAEECIDVDRLVHAGASLAINLRLLSRGPSLLRHQVLAPCAIEEALLHGFEGLCQSPFPMQAHMPTNRDWDWVTRANH